MSFDYGYVHPDYVIDKRHKNGVRLKTDEEKAEERAVYEAAVASTVVPEDVTTPGADHPGIEPTDDEKK